MKKETFYLSIIVSLIVTLSVTISQVMFAAWTEPDATPPNNNVASPVNESTTIQAKFGPLHIGAVAHGQQYGLQVTNGITWAKDGLQIEKRTNNPTSPAIGRMWILE